MSNFILSISVSQSVPEVGGTFWGDVTQSMFFNTGTGPFGGYKRADVLTRPPADYVTSAYDRNNAWNFSLAKANNAYNINNLVRPNSNACKFFIRYM